MRATPVRGRLPASDGSPEPASTNEAAATELVEGETKVLDELEEEYESVNKMSPVRSKAELEGLLTKALAEENYEEAAKLRDEIEKL